MCCGVESNFTNNFCLLERKEQKEHAQTVPLVPFFSEIDAKLLGQKIKELKFFKGMRLPSLYSKDPIYYKASFVTSVPYIAQSIVFYYTYIEHMHLYVSPIYSALSRIGCIHHTHLDYSYANSTLLLTSKTSLFFFRAFYMNNHINAHCDTSITSALN